MNPRILLVEDEPSVSLTVSDLLADEGYDVETSADGPGGLKRASSEAFDVVILDVMLPGMNGLDVCRELRRLGKDVAILMLTARGQLTDRVVGLKLGADDYLVKPFEPMELVARIEALLRRVRKSGLTPVKSFHFGDVEVDFERGDVRKSGVAVALAAKELELLRYLVDHRGNVVSREELLESVWEYQPGVSSRTLDVHVAWLRQKLEENPKYPQYILTIRGIGYKFAG
jgi:two-component system, OmpR family, alkaline phosphatase synthesis response regulator PhoP